ncbi:hypothetical protein EGW08_003003, partial [Elysia chlorotica]
CVATGQPTPDVLWYVNDATEPAGAAGVGRSDLVVGPVDGPVGVICVALNSAGAIFAPVRISVLERTAEDPIEPLQFTEDFPEKLTITSGGNVTIHCSATGSPAPSIRWYKDGLLVAQAGPGEVFALFHEKDITSNFSVRCVVSNALQLISADVDVVALEPERISVETYLVPVSEKKAIVNWVVTEGDVDAVRGFNVSLYDHQGKQLLSVHLSSQARSLWIRNPESSSSLKFVLKTLTSEGVADEDVMDLVFRVPDAGNETKLHVDVVEVRETQARLNIRVTGPGAAIVQSYRVEVKQVRPAQSVQVLTVEADVASLLIQDLEPNSQYELAVSAWSYNSAPLANHSLRFWTASSGGMGSQEEEGEEEGKGETTCPQCPACPTLSVSASPCADHISVTSGATRRPVDDTTEAAGLTSTVLVGGSDPGGAESSSRPTTLEPDTSSLSPVVTTLEPDTSSLSPVVTTLEPDTSSLSPVVTTLKPDTSSLSPVVTTVKPYRSSLSPIPTTTTLVPETTESQKFLLTMRLLAKSPTGIKLAWVVEKGDLRDIANFVVKLSTGSGRKLVESNVRRKARTLSLTSLRPNTAYAVSIKAIDNNGYVLGEAELPVMTSSIAASAEPSKPTLYFEASEIRNDQLRLIWAVQDAGDLKVSSFRLRVLNGDFGETELLSQKILPDRSNFLLQRLPPNRHLSMVLEVMGPDNRPVLTSGLEVDTPASGATSRPVVGASLTS